MAAIFAITIRVGDFRIKETVGLLSDLMRGTVINAKSLGSASNVYA